MLAFSIDYYGIFFGATQSVELFCAYRRIILRLPNIDNFRLNVYNKMWHIICKLQHKEFNGNQCSLEESWMIDGYVTVKYIAEKWELKPRTVQMQLST